MNRNERRRDEKLHGKQAGGADVSTALLREAQLHHQAGRLDEAERAFAEALRLDPNSTEVQAGQALVKRRRDELSHGVQ